MTSECLWISGVMPEVTDGPVWSTIQMQGLNHYIPWNSFKMCYALCMRND